MRLSTPLAAAALLLATQFPASAQTAMATGGALVLVPANGEVRHANDQVVISFVADEEDKDKSAAIARANRRMKEGLETLRRLDPRAELKTLDYAVRPVYPEEPDRPLPASRRQVRPAPVGWHVTQTIELTTMNLADLRKTVAGAQTVVGIDRLRFGVSPATEKLLDEQRIAATYRNLNERIASIARAMGRLPSEATLETVDFDGAGNGSNYGFQRVEVTGSRIKPDELSEPSLEPGETTLQMRLVGKVRFK